MLNIDIFPCINISFRLINVRLRCVKNFIIQYFIRNRQTFSYNSFKCTTCQLTYRVVCLWLRLVSIYYSIRTHVHVSQILGALTSGVWAVFRGINVNKSNVTFSIVVIGRCDYLVLMTITRLNVCVKTEYVAR